MPPQGRLANRRLPDFASRRLPDFDGAVVAATGNLLAIWTETNTRDRPVKSSIVSTHHTFENKKEKETAVTYAECPFNVDTHSRVMKLQIFTDLSLLPLAILVPSGLHATDQTLRLR